MNKWYEEVRMEPGSNYVSSRVRLARNWKDYCFPNRLSDAQAQDLVRELRRRLSDFSDGAGEPIREALLSDIPEVEVVVTMGCNVQCPFLPCSHREDWGLEDSSGKSDEAFLETIRLIEDKVLDLRKRLV